MRKVLVSGALALIGLAAPAAPVLTSAAAPPPAAAAAPAHPADPAHGPASTTCRSSARPCCPDSAPCSVASLRHATAVQSSNWAGYADTDDTYDSVTSSWTEPTVNCAGSGGGLAAASDGTPRRARARRPPSGSASTATSSSSVEQLGTDSDCDSGAPGYYAWYEMYPNPSVQLPSQDSVSPGDHMTALVASNSTGTSFTLMLKDSTANWSFSTTQSGSGFARSSAEVVAEAPSSCSLLFCSEVPLADFGQVVLLGLVAHRRRGLEGPALGLRRQRDHHGQRRHDAGHAEQPQPGRVVVLRELGQLIGRSGRPPQRGALTAAAPQLARSTHPGRRRRPVRGRLAG